MIIISVFSFVYSYLHLCELLGKSVKSNFICNFQYINKQPKMDMSGNKIIKYHEFHGDIEFKDVTFSYPTRPESVSTFILIRNWLSAPWLHTRNFITCEEFHHTIFI